MNSMEMFQAAIACLPAVPTAQLLKQKHEQTKYHPDGRPATTNMLRLLGFKLAKKGIKVKSHKVNSALSGPEALLLAHIAAK